MNWAEMAGDDLANQANRLAEELLEWRVGGAAGRGGVLPPPDHPTYRQAKTRMYRLRPLAELVEPELQQRLDQVREPTKSIGFLERSHVDLIVHAMIQERPGWRGAKEREILSVRRLVEACGGPEERGGVPPTRTAHGPVWEGNPNHTWVYRLLGRLRSKMHAGILHPDAAGELDVAFPGWSNTGEDCPPCTASPPPSACRMALFGVGGGP